jgi:ketosteroid isomerase-like protein
VGTNQQTVETYLEGFRRGDHAMVLGCLTDDVEWVIPGAFHLRGQEAFDREIENPGFEGHPEITVTRMVEAGDVVVVEGVVKTRRKGGPVVPLAFCDVFDLRQGRIRRLVSYLMDTGGGERRPDEG